jgi:hypothetical protein
LRVRKVVPKRGGLLRKYLTILQIINILLVNELVNEYFKQLRMVHKILIDNILVRIKYVF